MYFSEIIHNESEVLSDSIIEVITFVLFETMVINGCLPVRVRGYANNRWYFFCWQTSYVMSSRGYNLKKLFCEEYYFLILLVTRYIVFVFL